MSTYTLLFPDNDSNMYGSADKLSVAGVPYCQKCEFKTDLYLINPLFKVKRRVYDLSSTYDGYVIASLKFVEACRRLSLHGFEFLPLSSDPEYFVVKPAAFAPFDRERRKTRFEGLCPACGQYRAVAGAHPVFLLAEPEADLSGTDVVFGSGNSRSRVLLATGRAKLALQAERLKGLTFVEVAGPA